MLLLWCGAIILSVSHQLVAWISSTLQKMTSIYIVSRYHTIPYDTPREVLDFLWGKTTYQLVE